MKKKVFLAVLVVMVISSCSFFENEQEGIPVARVNNSFLYKSDIEDLVTPNMFPEDSALVVNGFVERWARQQLLLDGAKRNIAINDQERMENLVEQYRADLYAQAYKDVMVAKGLDSAVTNAEVKSFYENNKENFKLNEDLLRLRYIQISENAYNLDDVKKKFTRFNNEDKRYLDSISVQFKAQSLNDSIWISADQVVKTIPAITPENKDEYLKNTSFLQLRDSLGLYLIAIEEKLSRNEEAPLDYVIPTVKQVLVNRKKLDLIKKLEKDIIKDAIKNNQFEVYDKE